MQGSGGALLAAGLDGGDTLIFFRLGERKCKRVPFGVLRRKGKCKRVRLRCPAEAAPDEAGLLLADRGTRCALAYSATGSAWARGRLRCPFYKGVFAADWIRDRRKVSKKTGYPTV